MNSRRKPLLTCFGWLGFILCLGLGGGAVHAEELDLKFGITSGFTSYEEKVSLVPVDSEWDGVFVGSTGLAVLRYNPSYEIHLKGSIWMTGNDTERWSESGVRIQENDLEVAGSEWSVAVVKNFHLEKGWDAGIRFGPSIAFEKYTRDNFIFYSDQRVIGSEAVKMDEDVFLAALNLGFNLRAQLSPRNWVEWDAELGYIAIDQADNDAIPETIEGSGGYSIKSSLLFNHALKDNHTVGAGLVLAGRSLDGETMEQTFQGRSLPVEWPENELLSFGIQIFWKGSF